MSEPMIAACTERYVPKDIRDEPLWVLWDLQDKTPIAPWQTGHCYRAEWRADLPSDKRPETDYETAKMYADLPPSELHKTHPFPVDYTDDRPLDALPQQVVPTILLPPYPAVSGFEPALMYIDLDDVRDPETGEITPEAQAIVDRLESFTEISSSGTGLHILVRADLPEPNGKIVEDLDTVGQIEIYDHGRFLGGTWKHTTGTPKEINEQQASVNELIEKYRPTKEPSIENKTGGPAPKSRSGTSTPISTPSTSQGDRSPFYDVPLEKFAQPATIVNEEVGNSGSKNKGPQGPHPVHGKTTSGDESTNYHLDPDTNQWHCFACGSGGGPLGMAAIMARTMQCRNAQQGSLDRLSDEEFLRTCLHARDEVKGFTADMTPPYRALVAIASLLDLTMDDPERRILGRATYSIAEHVFEELSLGELEDLGDDL
jgi:hypothetical protein